MAVKLVDFINEYDPSVIVCTHPFPLQMLSSLKQKGIVTIPVIGIVTDFSNHLFWKLDGVDAFIVAHEYIKNDMIKAGMQREKIHTLGIPVSQTFLQKNDRFQLTQELGLKNKLKMLVMGGSLGFGEFRDVFASLLKCNRDIQVIAVTGHNKKLEKELNNIISKTTDTWMKQEAERNINDINARTGVPKEEIKEKPVPVVEPKGEKRSPEKAPADHYLFE